MKNLSTKKKVIIILSIIGAILSAVALILGMIFIVSAKDVIANKQSEYNVNTATILWISKQGSVFFGNSTGLAVFGIVLGLVGLFSISGLWIIAGIKKKVKKVGSEGSIVGVATVSVGVVAAVAGVGLLAQGSILFKQSSDVDKTIEYFEKNAKEISKDKEKASKAALLYTLANKEGISSFSAVSSLQISMAGLLLGDMKLKEQNLIAVSNKDKYKNLFKEPAMIADFKKLDAKVKFKHPKTQASIGGEKWLKETVATIPLMGSSAEFIAAAVINNIDSWNEMINGDYPEIHKMISGVMKKGYTPESVIWGKIPVETQKLLVEFGFVKDVSTGEFIKEGAFELLQKLAPSSIKFERRVIGTLGILMGLPYETKADKFKTRITILEWLNTVVNSIDYISKDQEFEMVGTVDSSYPSGQIFEKAIITNTPQNIYGGTYNEDGSIEVLTTDDKLVGQEGDSMYDVKLNLMKKVLEELQSEEMFKKISKRQSTITAATFAKHIIDSKGLKALTGQYAIFNSGYDDNDQYGDAGYAKHIKETKQKIEKFIK